MILEEIKSAFAENKLAIFVSIAILFISLILGYIFEPQLYDYFNPVVDDLTQKIQSGTVKITFQDIFLNNINIIFSMFIYGMCFCFSALILGFNGFFVGYYVATSNNLVATLLLIIPHGVFEFSSCILACASGFVLFHFVLKFLVTLWREDDDSVKLSILKSFDEAFPKLKQAIILFIISAILMAIAGFVEAYLTLPIASAIANIIF